MSRFGREPVWLSQVLPTRSPLRAVSKMTSDLVLRKSGDYAYSRHGLARGQLQTRGAPEIRRSASLNLHRMTTVMSTIELMFRLEESPIFSTRARIESTTAPEFVTMQALFAESLTMESPTRMHPCISLA